MTRKRAPEGSLGECASCGGDYPVRADGTLAPHRRYVDALDLLRTARPARTVPCEGSGARPGRWTGK